MADAKKKTFEDFVGVPRHGPDPVDDAKVTEFTQRSQDPRAAPWEALRRGGAQLDSALGTGPGSQRSALDQGVQNLGRYLQPPVAGQPWPGPEVGPTRDVGHFESLAQKIPDALTSPTFQAMAFPTGEESLARMRDEAVFRDQMESKGAREVTPRELVDRRQAIDRERQELSPSELAGRNARISRVSDANSQARSAADIYGDQANFESVRVGSDPTLEPLRRFDANSTEPIPDGPTEARIPEPSAHPERPTLEAFLSKLYGRR